MVYKTKQREQVLDIIKNSNSKHVTVESILNIIKKDNIDISRATLYRTLDLLVNSGALKKIIVDEKNPPCYQLCELEDNDHFHLVCEKCGKLFHLDCEKVGEGGNDKTLLLYIKHPWLIAKTFIRWQKKYTKEQKKIISKFSGKFVKSYFGSIFYYMKKKRRDLSDE